MRKRIVLFALCVALLLFAAACDQGAPVSGGRDIAGITVLIDAGHGDTDVGTIGAFTGRYEKDVNLEIALKLRGALEERGVTVLMTRADDAPLGPPEEADISLRKENDMLKREEIIEGAGADIFISIHQNSFEDETVAGPQIFYLKNADTGEVDEDGKTLAEAIQAAMNEELGVAKPRQAISSNLRLLKKGNHPACLVECGFFSNEEEERLLQTEEYQQRLVEAIVKGIEAYVRRHGV